jgi:hypothetical protein
MEFFFDIHTAVDHANDCNLAGLDRVKDEVKSYHEATQPDSKARTFPANEWESSQILEIRVYSANEIIRRVRTSFFEVPIDSKQIQLCFVGKKDDHSRNYLSFVVRA